MKAAIYARYSSNNQREASIEDQVRLCRQMIEQQGWEPVDTYSDRAISGASMIRPGYQRLLADAAEGKFGVVVAEALDRLSRDQEHIAALYKQLTFLGIRLVTQGEGEISELHVGLKGTMNALYLKDLALKTRRGLEGRVRQGKSGGGLCYGYRVVQIAGPNGEHQCGEREIVEEEAAVIRRIFRDYANGRSPKAIARRLNRGAIPGPRRKDWGQSTINGNAARGTGILNNELYIGRLVWNRLRYIKDPNTGKRISRPNPEEDWIIHEVPHLRIVPQDLWDAVKARQAKLRQPREGRNAERPFWDRRRPRYLFSGLVKCGACGGGYSKISQTLLGCSTARNKGTCDNRINIRRDTLEATVLDALKHQLMDPNLFKTFAEEFYRELNRLRSRQSADQVARKEELSRIERRIQRIVDAIAEGAPARALSKELLDLETRQEALEGELRDKPEPAPLILPNLAEVYRRKVADLHLALEDDATRDEAFEIIRSLVDAIVLTPEGGALRIDLRGDIAHILSLAANSRKPAAFGDGLVEQVKLVAGACNHRELTLVVAV